MHGHITSGSKSQSVKSGVIAGFVDLLVTLSAFVAADRKLTHLRRLCRLKTDPGVLLALPKFWAGDKQGDHDGNVGKNSTNASTRQSVVT